MTDNADQTAVLAAPVVADAAPADPGTWEGLMLVAGIKTGDGRMMAPEGGSTRELPIPLRLARADEGGHWGAVPSGSVTAVDQRGDEWHGSGCFDSGDDGQEHRRLASEGTMAGLSVDLDAIDVEMIPDPEWIAEQAAGILIDTWTWCDEEGNFSEVPYVSLFTQWRICGLTGVSIPAFEEAKITLVAAGAEQDVLALHDVGNGTWRVWIPQALVAAGDNLAALVAAAIKEKPVTVVASVTPPPHPPEAWMDNPELSDLTPLTITSEGRVFGHLAPRDQPHRSFSGARITVPLGQSYEHFHQGFTECEGGQIVRTGNLVALGGHPDVHLSADEAKAAYDDAGTIWATVRAGEDEFGVWVAGAVLPDVDEFTIRRARACCLSGDWRPMEGFDDVQLIAALSVPTGGFPILPRARVADGRLMALVASGPAPGQNQTVAGLIATLAQRLDRIELADLDRAMSTV